MANTEKNRRWLVLLVTGVVLIALGVIFLVLGLQDADRLASTIGALAGVAGLGLAIWSASPTHRSAAGQVAKRNGRARAWFLFTGTGINGDHNIVGDKNKIKIGGEAVKAARARKSQT